VETDASPGEEEEPLGILVAVPEDGVDELVSAGLVKVIPTIRGAVLDAVVTVGSDAAVLVTLLQAPQTIREFAGWVVARCHRRKTTLVITARRGEQHLELRVDGDIPVEAVTRFLVDAVGQISTDIPDSQPQTPDSS
jgi:hypothetical protein